MPPTMPMSLLKPGKGTCRKGCRTGVHGRNQETRGRRGRSDQEHTVCTAQPAHAVVVNTGCLCVHVTDVTPGQR